VDIDKKQIYIVDDDESICRALKFLLISFGFEVSTFSSAEEFFSIVQNSILGCLVLDIHMPGMDGWHVLRRITESGSKCPVIIITADKSGWMEEDVLKAGAVGFLQKPFNAQALVDLVNRAFLGVGGAGLRTR
jgi:FixJ family two-component response regulator